jgi:peptide/nickel transport system permease protein
VAAVEMQAETLLTERQESWLKIVWRRFRRHKLAMAGMTVVLFLILVSVLANVIAPYHPIREMDLHDRNAGPSAQHLMGTDVLGRDIFSRLLYAGRISLFVAFTVIILSETFGAIVGAVSGFYGGWVDAVVQRFTEFMITLPTLPLLLAFSAILRGMSIPWLPREWSSAAIVILVLTVFGWMGACRLVRGMVLSLREREFIEASRALGMGDLRIIMRHMLPNALPPLIVDATLGLGGVIIAESSLSFLALGISPPVPTWGNMLSEYRADMWMYPVKVLFPGLAIFLASLSFNYVGDGLRDALDPRLKL